MEDGQEIKANPRANGENYASGGIVDKAGETWWPSTEAMNGAALVRALDNRSASIEEYAAAREYLRPVLVSSIECKRVLLDGPTFQNSPAWNIHPLMCEDLVVRNVTALNPWYSQNGDGLDLDSCRRAAVTTATSMSATMRSVSSRVAMSMAKNEAGLAGDRDFRLCCSSRTRRLHGRKRNVGRRY